MTSGGYFGALTHLLAATIAAMSTVPSPEVGSVQIAGVRLALLDEAGVISYIIEAARGRRGGWLVTPNVDIVRIASKDADVMELISTADLMVADGMPLIWASRLRGTPLPERVAGSNLIWSLTGSAYDAGLSVFLLGGAPGAARAGALKFTERFPGLDVAWHYPPFGFENDPSARTAIVGALKEANASIVYCGLGFPKQEWLIRDLRQSFPHTWFIGSGAAVNFVAGQQSRAPHWMQRAGLEWIHRLIKEPRRLFRRYVIEDIPFALSLVAAAVRDRIRHVGDEGGGSSVTSHDPT